MIRFFKHLLSRYSPRYVRSLVYMMQASEYYTSDYLRWYHRTGDFAHVEKRKKLDLTAKARVLLWSGYGLWVIFLIIALWGISVRDDVPQVVAALILFGSPFFLPYLMAAVLRVVNLCQRPFEMYAIARAKRKLRKHKGMRIAIAGSYGKTTMREILKTVLSTRKKIAAPDGSKNTPLGIAELIESLEGDEEVLIFELGEYYPGDVRYLCDFVDPQWGIVTGVNEAHFERFGSIHSTIGTIFELADYLGPKPLYVNGESVQARAREAHRRVIYDRTGAGDWRVISTRSDLSGLWLGLELHGKRYEAHTPLLGIHNTGPILAACDIASRLGLWPEHIIAGIAQIQPFEHRMQPRSEGGITIIDDSYNGNPDGAAAAIEFLKGIPGRRFYVTPGLVEMGDRSEEVHRTMGKNLAEAGIEHVILISDSVTPHIAQGLKDGGFRGDLKWFDDMPAALQALPHLTVAGDIILIQNDWPDQYA